MHRHLLPILLVLAASLPAAAQLAGSQNPFATQDNLARALLTQDVAVERTFRRQIDTSALQRLVREAPPDRPLKIAVTPALPRSGQRYGSGDRYTQALHDFLGLGRGTLVIVTQRRVFAATDALSSQEISRILRENARHIQTGDPVEGIRRIVHALNGSVSSQAQAAQARQRTTTAIVWLVVLAGGAVVLVLIIRRAMAARQALAAARAPVERLHREVVEGISYADTYLDLLPDSEDARAAREARAEAAALLEQARAIARSGGVDGLGRAQALLEQASERIQACRRHVDAATGGTGFAVAVEGTEYRATPAAGSAATRHAPLRHDVRPEDIPESERAACFFCSRPARISDLTPVDIAIEGQRRKVLACDEDVRIVKEGATPEFRTVKEDGQTVPWFRSRRYDPYRDYDREPMYAPGYGYGGGSPFGGFLGGLLLGQVLGGWHAPYPVFVDRSGGASTDPQEGFSGDSGGGWEPQLEPVEHAGFGDLFGMGGFDGGDQGGSDFGGDWGGGDFGGGDFGGGDFGGGDFGGGDFGGGD